MYHSPLTFFVDSMKVSLQELMEAQFYLAYFCHTPPMDFNELPVYERRSMVKLLLDQKTIEKDFRDNKYKS